MESHQKNTRRVRIWIATLLMLAMQIGVAVLGRVLPDEAAVGWSVMLATMSTLTIAWVVAPLTPYSKATHWVSAAVLALSVMVSGRVVPASVWLDSARHQMWLLAWFPLMMATLRPARQGRCAPRAKRMTWLMVGASAFLGSSVMFAGLITAWRHGS